MLLSAASVLHGRYRILRVLAQGGMGVVYEATDQALFNRRVAVKEIVVTSGDAAERTDTIRRFTREARLLAEVHHVGIPHIYDYFQDGLCCYLVMEFVEGKTLAEVLSRGPSLDVVQGLRWTAGIAEILSHLHHHKPPIVFRDVKPANVMIADDGAVQLIDFGIAWLACGRPTKGLGTPGFAPPEQYARGECEPAMDVYGLGATAYRVFTGQDPPEATARAFSGATLRPLRELNPMVPPEAATLIHSMLKVLPRLRPASMDEVRATLERVIAVTAPPSVAPSPVAPITGTVLVADDDERLRKLVTSLLESAGFHAIAVADGTSAVTEALASHPDLVILDVEMPRMGGIDACRMIRQTSSVPILMLTGLGAEADRVVGLELGADDYVTKPFSSRELLARVRALLRRKR